MTHQSSHEEKNPPATAGGSDKARRGIGGEQMGNRIALSTLSPRSRWLYPEWGNTTELETSGAPAATSTDVLKRAGLTTATKVNSKTATHIQSALQQSRALSPFIAAKLRTITISKNFVVHGWEQTFEAAYLKLHKIVVPLGSKKEGLNNVRAFYHRPTDTIHVRPTANIGHALQAAVQKLASPPFRLFFGEAVDQGVSLYFANLVLTEQGLAPMTPEQQKGQLRCATILAGLVGINMTGKAYFENHSDLINHLTSKLSIGPVRTDELSRDALCKTSLLATARFAGHTVERMVSVGMTGPRSVRLWMRTDVPGSHELRISGDARGPRTTNIMISPGQPGDKTIAINYPQSSSDPPLEPSKKYTYRVVRTSDGAPLSEGSFETAPASDAATPEKVVIGVTSCHQPFATDGTIDSTSARMLRLLPRILQENKVKFMLLCGDQMYADDPGIFSILKNPYLLRRALPGKKSIDDCSPEEIRRAYDMRYRMFWSMPSIRKMYANYPCYPAIDDHEIMNAWGSMPAHSQTKFRVISHGARLAYRDYQLSSILPVTPNLPQSFHYNFSYGNIGIFVMDVRSQRNQNRNQLFSVAQLDDLRQFLRNNATKKVLLIVSSVPVVFIPGGLANVGARLKPSTFLDHWSHSKNIPSRNAFLSLLHDHQQKYPQQRVAIVSGDVHIGNALRMTWRGGNKPRLYQFTSSAITARETRCTQFWIERGQEFSANVDFPRPCFGGNCSAEVRHLPAANEASAKNPYVGLNLGLIEIQRSRDVSNLNFKLIGAHPTEERHVTYFESGWLN
jgi:alkaline phosphatase D